MAPDAPLVLAFDTSAAHCAVALFRQGGLDIAKAETVARGQAELLMPMITDVMNTEGVKFSDLNVIGVGIGPGNFTGIRISVSAARGLSLSLGVPAIGVSGFEAATGETDRPALIPAPRARAYLHRPGQPPALVAMAEAEAVPGICRLPPPAPHAGRIARYALQKWRQGGPSGRPAPLYIRPADAAPPADPPPVILP